MLRCPIAVAALATLALWTTAARADAPACARPDGATPVIQPTQQRQARALLAPWTVGAPIPDAPPGWTLAELALEPAALRVHLTAPDDAITLRLTPAACAPDAPGNSLSFQFHPTPPPQTPAGAALLARLQAHITANDRTPFFTTWLPRPPTAAERAAARPDLPPAPGLFAVPLHHSTTGIALVLLTALVFLLADLRPLARDLGLTRATAPRTLALLAALLAIAYALRTAAGPTWLREAHPFLAIPAALDSPVLGYPIETYPQGPQLLFRALTSLLPASLLGDPFAAWLRVNVLLGTLTVAFAFALGAALPTSPSRPADSRAATGLLAAALCAFWPQHIRVSASESVHTALALAATAALALALVAARTGRHRTFIACAGCAASAALMRPEGALWLAVIALAALAAGPGVRRRLLSPPRLLAVAALAWLTLPTVLSIASTDAAARLAPTSGANESVGATSLFDLIALLSRPDTGRNAYFDWTNTPPWLWPLAIWGAAITLRRGPGAARGAALGLLAGTVGYLVLYAHMGPAGVVWTVARYQLAAFPAVLGLTTLGAVDLLSRVPRLATPSRAATAGAALAAAGCGLWWPAVPVHMDWQQELAWAIDLGRQRPPLIPDHARLVTPDNRRRFLDMAPRDLTRPLTAGRIGPSAVVTVEHALRDLDPARTPAYFYQGLYCYLAVAPQSAEPQSPQCAAMAATFDLEPVATQTLTGPPYLQAYVHNRPTAPLTIGLYRITSRRLPPEAALRLLPAPLPKNGDRPSLPMASGTLPQQAPPDPPLR